ADGGRPAVGRTAGGYQLAADAELVDLHRFRRLMDQARAAGRRDPRRAALLTAAIGLWRGDPLGGVPGMWASRVRDGLRQQRLDAAAERADAELDRGAHRGVVERRRGLRVEVPL